MPSWLLKLITFLPDLVSLILKIIGSTTAKAAELVGLKKKK